MNKFTKVFKDLEEMAFDSDYPHKGITQFFLVMMAFLALAAAGGLLALFLIIFVTHTLYTGIFLAICMTAFTVYFLRLFKKYRADQLKKQ